VTTTTERSISLPVFECDQCGACCEHLLVEVDQVDAMREPRIHDEARLLDGNGELPVEDWQWSLNGLKSPHRCVFLGEDKRCGIYATRPSVCVAVQAGGEQCQLARGFAGLAPLVATVREASVMDRVREAWRVSEDER
jgi:hypothetical protein